MASLAVGLGSSLLGGILGRPKAQTSTSTSTSTQTNDPIDGPKGRKLAKTASVSLIDMIRNPQINNGLRLQNRGQINDVYNQQQNRLDSILAARGFGNSGKANLNTMQLEQGRAKAMGDLESNLYQDAVSRQMQALGLAQGFSRPVGFNSTTNTESSGTTPGMSMSQALGQGIAGAGGDISEIGRAS